MHISKEDALNYHTQGKAGKIEVTATKPTATQMDLSLAYTPGVAIPVLDIAEEPKHAYNYTAKGNLVAVVTNGTAILGLGNKGALAAKPVMEGKAILFKRFADIDVFDIELESKDPDEVIQTVKNIAPTFGGINLEDIKAPECFYIEEKLKSMLDIPVFHDDQHGTAIISTAALINALYLQKKKIEDVKIVVNGAGAAAIACAELFILAGAKREHITMLDTRGVIYEGRSEGMNEYKKRFARKTKLRTLEEAVVNADVFAGLSSANILTPEMLLSMDDTPVILAMANPDPEIDYELAKKTNPNAIVATGRSDFPNQVNNVLGFPFIFRGALDVRAKQINDAMKLAAVDALVQLAREEIPQSVLQAYGLKSLSFGSDYIVPTPFDPRALTRVAPAVAAAAMQTDVARIKIDIKEYIEQLAMRLDRGRELMRVVVEKAKSNPKRVVFAEGEHPNVIRAAYLVQKEKIGIPILLGKQQVIEKEIQNMQMEFSPEIIDPETSKHFEKYAETIFTQRQRKGLTLAQAKDWAKQPAYYGPLMIELGDADCYLTGINYRMATTLRPSLQIIGHCNKYNMLASMYIVIIKKKVFFLADPTVNIDPDENALADIAIMTADAVKNFDIEPKIAMLSFSNFGGNRDKRARKMAVATEIVKQKRKDLQIDGEMTADTAVTPEIIETHFPFSEVKDANVLIFPSLEAANTAYKLLRSLGGAEAIGPVLLGMGKPVHVLEHEADSRAIFNMAALAVVDSQISGCR